MQIHEVKREHKNKRGKIIGRGGKRGTTSGKGTKGQLARSGRKLRPELRDLIKKIPKLRGYRFKSIQDKIQVVNTDTLNKLFDAGKIISPKILAEKGLVKRVSGRAPVVKIVAGKEKVKNFVFYGVKFSEGSKKAVLEGKGTIQPIK